MAFPSPAADAAWTTICAPSGRCGPRTARATTASSSRSPTVTADPRPVDGSVPIVVGGHSEPAARRAGRLGDGFFPALGDADELKRLLRIMRESAEAAGRDPDAIEITANGGPPNHIRRMADLGVSRVIVPPMPPDRLATFGEDVIAKFS